MKEKSMSMGPADPVVTFTQAGREPKQTPGLDALSSVCSKTFIHTHTHTHTHTHLYFMSPHEVPPFPRPLSYLGLDALPFIQDKSLERGVSSAPCSKVYLLDSRHHLYVIDSQIHSPCTDLFFESRPIASSLPHHLEISKVVRSTKEQNRTYSPGNQF